MQLVNPRPKQIPVDSPANARGDLPAHVAGSRPGLAKGGQPWIDRVLAVPYARRLAQASRQAVLSVVRHDVLSNSSEIAR